MAGKAVMADRVDRALRMLLAGHSASRVVSELSDRWGVSRRQGRRIVGRAYAQIQADLNEAAVDRVDLIAQLVNQLQEGAAKAYQCNNIGAMVGCIRELRELAQLGFDRPASGYSHGRSRHG